ncbi:Glycine receptor subunit alpha-3 [Branchiostoma belcheri]|nr:Glycine receptor subunit alpha-3 [Branchiostoma belcheri]
MNVTRQPGVWTDEMSAVKQSGDSSQARFVPRWEDFCICIGITAILRNTTVSQALGAAAAGYITPNDLQTAGTNAGMSSSPCYIITRHAFALNKTWIRDTTSNIFTLRASRRPRCTVWDLRFLRQSCPDGNQAFLSDNVMFINGESLPSFMDTAICSATAQQGGKPFQTVFLLNPPPRQADRHSDNAVTYGGRRGWRLPAQYRRRLAGIVSKSCSFVTSEDRPAHLQTLAGPGLSVNDSFFKKLMTRNTGGLLEGFEPTTPRLEQLDTYPECFLHQPVDVSCSVYIDSMGSFSEKTMDFSLSLIMGCEWSDFRLANISTDSWSPPPEMHIWKPSIEVVMKEESGESHPVVSVSPEGNVLQMRW